METLKNNRRKSTLVLTVRILASLSGLGMSSAWANNIAVNSLNDVVLADGQCALREAIINANANTDNTGGDCVAGLGADNITFSVSGTVTLASTLVVTDAVGLNIDGNGQKVVLNGNNAVRVLKVNPGMRLTVNNLTIANGFSQSSAFMPAGGAGIFNDRGFLTAANMTFNNNITTGRGGAVANLADNSTAPATGGQASITNSTFVGNQAFVGGAINTGFGSSLTVANSTVVSNKAVTPVCPPGQFCAAVVGFGGGIVNDAGTFKLYNSIVGNNTENASPSDLYGIINNGSYNLIGSANGFGSLEVKNGVNGNVVGNDTGATVSSGLADNGGSTQTLMLLAGSPAIDAIPATNCPAIDQRGMFRPQGAGCDTGAFEAAATADLAVVQVATPNPVSVRDAITWNLSITNNGPGDASNVKVVDTLPVSGLRSITASPSQGSCGVAAGGAITCNLGSLAHAGSATVSIRAVTGTVGSITNKVTVAADQTDSQTANNTAALVTTVETLLCKGLKPTIIGSPDTDVITGTIGKDIIHALGGNDTVSGGGDNDIICGGEGQDLINGEGGNDYIDGGAATDSCNGGKGTDSAVNCEAKTAIP